MSTATETTLSGFIRIASPGPPNIVGQDKLPDNRIVIRTTEDRRTTLVCVSSGGIPAPTVAWYMNSTQTTSLASISSGELQTDGTYKVTLKYTLVPRRSDDRKTFTCRSYYPHATSNETLGVRESAVQLYLNLKPHQPEVVQTNNPVSGQNVTIECRTSGGRPEPAVSWTYRGLNFIPPVIVTMDPVSETYSAVSKLHRRVNVFDDGLSATCHVNNKAIISALSNSVKINVSYSAEIQPMADITEEEGRKGVVLSCKVSSNPVSEISWYRPHKNISLVRAYGNKTDDGYNILNYTLDTVSRHDDGRYRCRAENGIGQSDEKDVQLRVRYLIVRTINTTTDSNFTTVKCDLNNFETDTYITEPWVQNWPGYGKVNERPFSKILKLKNLTYEYSGVYICKVKANDDIAIDVHGKAALLVKSPPVILKPEITQSRYEIGGRLNDKTILFVHYYSNVPNSVVNCYHSINRTKSSTPVGTVVLSNVTVQLPVFSHTVPTPGTMANVTIMIDRETDFGDYDIVITNGIGSGATLRLNVFPQDTTSSPVMLIGVIVGAATCIIIIAVIVVTIMRIKWRNSSNDEVKSKQTNRKTGHDNKDYNYVTENAMYISADEVEQPTCAPTQSNAAEMENTAATDPSDLYAVPDKSKKAGAESSDLYAVPDKSRKDPDSSDVYAVPDKAMKAGN